MKPITIKNKKILEKLENIRRLENGKVKLNNIQLIEILIDAYHKGEINE